jgi:hypothetical protein
MRGELRAVAATQNVSAARAAWLRVQATMADTDLQCVVVFCVIGLLLTINIILRVPDFAATSATLNFFP